MGLKLDGNLEDAVSVKILSTRRYYFSQRRGNHHLLPKLSENETKKSLPRR